MRFTIFIALAFLSAGCASTPEPASYLLQRSDALPVSAAFVYEEEVHGVDGAFRIGPVFWDHAYPTAAESVNRADRFASYDEALTSGADLIVIAKNRVYGGRDIYKTSLVLYIRNQNRTLLAETGFQGKQTTRKDEASALRAIGRLMRHYIRNSEKVQRLARSKGTQ